MTEIVNMRTTGSQNTGKAEQLLAAAKELFWKYGIRRVSVEEICREAGVSKMTFYKHFRNRNHIAQEIITRITTESMEEFRAVMRADLPAGEKIGRLIEMKMQGTDAMSREFLDDIHGHASEELHAFMAEHYRKNITEVVTFFTEAQKRGDIRQDIRPEFILYFLEQMIRMAEDPVLGEMYTDPASLIEELTKFFFYGIMKRES